jgi:5-methylcytosine-specific restriction endonuclease McrA
MEKLLQNPVYRIGVRTQLVKRQGGRCCYCHRQFTKSGPTRATIEHKKARMDGGLDDLDNLAAACLHCNQHRGIQKFLARQKTHASKRAAQPTQAEENKRG